MALEIGGGITIGGGVSIVDSGGGGGGGDIYGTITVGNYPGSGNRYGVQLYFGPGPYGDASTTPVGILNSLYYRQSVDNTSLIFYGGTYGSIVVDALDGFIVGCSSLDVTVGGSTATLALGGPGLVYSIAGDPFNLASQDGSTLSVNMIIN